MISLHLDADSLLWPRLEPVSRIGGRGPDVARVVGGVSGLVVSQLPPDSVSDPSFQTSKRFACALTFIPFPLVVNAARGLVSDLIAAI